jgi:D-alanyl-D-alanine carboxypeptidase (penicillin-binding protein 5/6)
MAVLQVVVAAVAIAALVVVALRAGDDSGVPIAASGAAAGTDAGVANGSAATSGGSAASADGSATAAGGSAIGTGVRTSDASSFEPSSPAPIELLAVDAFDVEWRKPPRAALVFDVANGDSLYRRRATAELPIASLTKIMTALAVTAATERDEVVRIPKGLRYEGSAVGLLPLGRRVKLEPLLAGLLLVSGNDAASALAHHVSGSGRRFVALMNEHARLWNLDCTDFATPHGLSDGGRTFGVVLLDSPDPGKQAARLLDLAFRYG